MFSPDPGLGWAGQTLAVMCRVGFPHLSLGDTAAGL
jgi:hypothetical protein